jgi:hypothetical protein
MIQSYEELTVVYILLFWYYSLRNKANIYETSSHLDLYMYTRKRV